MTTTKRKGEALHYSLLKIQLIVVTQQKYQQTIEIEKEKHLDTLTQYREIER